MLIGSKKLEFLYFHDPNFGFATKAKAWKSVGQECNPRITFALSRMWGTEPTCSQMDSHFESWNPYGISNFQRDISRAKTHWIKELFISLDFFWNVDV
jgi:hypothetical protein